MTLKSQTNTQINRQQDARRQKKFVRARLITLVSQSKHGGKVLKVVLNKVQGQGTNIQTVEN